MRSDPANDLKEPFGLPAIRRNLRAVGLTRTNLAKLLGALGIFPPPQASAAPPPPRWHDVAFPWADHRRPRDDNPKGGTTKGTRADDTALIERLLHRYRATFDASYYAQGMWGTFFHGRQTKLHDAFMHDDKAAAEILRNPAETDLLHGYDNLLSRDVRASVDREFDRSVSTHLKMHLISLGEALGVARVDNPENYAGDPTPRVGPDTEELLELIDAALGIRIEFPSPYAGEFGLATSRGVIGYRSIQAIYQAHRIRELAPESVVEIGGGLGRTAYYAHCLGIRNYAIVDLPLQAIAQGYFLGRTLPPDTVQLLTPEEFLSSSDRHALVVNIDSLTEMPLSVQERYCHAIRQRAEVFLSINHEANEHTVREVMKVAPKRRIPYWMRRGYVDELYELT